VRRLLVALAVSLVAAPAFACSPVKGYRTPTNLELVQQADLILIARIVSGPDDFSGPNADIDATQIEIAPVKVLKGALPKDALRLAGMVKWNDRPVPSLPSPLATSHFSTGMGACVRTLYSKGGLVLAMFKATPAKMKAEHPYSMMPLFEPFARSAEDVESEDGVWAKAAQAYVALLAGTDKAHLRAAVERRRAELLGQANDMVAQAMADDLAYYLDQTGKGAPKVHDSGAHWRLIDLPDESAALIGSEKIKARILRCRAGGDGVQVYWPQEEGATATLRLGDHAFALATTKSDLPDDMKAASGVAHLDAPLREALLHGTGDAGVESKAMALRAPPLDILQKLGQRCAALLKRSQG